jgi:hypothetical protein
LCDGPLARIVVIYVITAGTLPITAACIDGDSATAIKGQRGISR